MRMHLEEYTVVKSQIGKIQLAYSVNKLFKTTKNTNRFDALTNIVKLTSFVIYTRIVLISQDRELGRDYSVHLSRGRRQL